MQPLAISYEVNSNKAIRGIISLKMIAKCVMRLILNLDEIKVRESRFMKW